MKKQIIFIHGGEVFSNHEEYLKNLKEWDYKPSFILEKKWSKNFNMELGGDFEVHKPTMPCKYNAKYLEWKIWFEKVLKFIKEDCILIGYSLGGTFLLKYLSENEFPVKINKLILLAPAFYDEKEWTLGDFNFKLNKENILKQVNKIYLFHSKDDPIVPFEHSEKIKEEIPEAQLITFSDRGHFFQEEFPELVKELKSSC